ncbi:helix-turn-helix domain-containing protein [Streptomyces bluensis]|uniref:Helix-turn-helix domain-containing protein n=2 Tax=Streptomyces bluensis TaxID=33897 RepID=A0ABW6UQT8_9ACTN
MLKQPHMFGPELRRLRLAAGLTLTQLASSVHYSKGQLSKIETGQKRPTAEFARLCDAALDAGGALSALVPSVPTTSSTATPLDEAGADMRRGTTEPDLPGRAHWPLPPSRRQVMAVGAASVLGATPAYAAPAPTAALAANAGPYLLVTCRDLFHQYRRLGQVSPPITLLPALAEQTRALGDLAAHSEAGTRSALLNLSARYAEFTGWMAQEAGDDEAALSWTKRAVGLAEEAGDRDLASYALTRRALISYYRGDAAETISLASTARSPRLPVRIRGLAAQHEGQGHALAGDYDACLRDLDRARALLDADHPDPATPQLGATHLSDPITMITGWCLLDLGRPRQAAAVLDEACARLPVHALRTQARYGIRRALAHALSGEVDHACAIARELLPAVRAADSATIRLDLRRLARTLARFRSRPAVAELSPDLTAALHTSLG